MNMIKAAALRAVSWGVRLPEEPISRIDELVRLRELLKALNVDCVLDVGANIGQFAKEVRGIGYSGAIVSFEPIASVFASLSETFRRDVKWTGHNIALGEAEGETVINIPNKTVNASLLQPVSGEKTRPEKIKVRRLDSIDLPFSRIFLKMDTQGFDLKAFAGAAGIMDRIVGLQSELSVTPLYAGMPDYADSLLTYKSAGFKLFNVCPVNRVDSGGLLEMNCTMHR
jgi:FkbM family methyltransferase